MARWLKAQQQSAPEGNPFVFHGQCGYPVDNQLIGWQDACKRAGLPGLPFHDLRPFSGSQYEAGRSA